MNHDKSFFSLLKVTAKLTLSRTLLKIKKNNDINKSILEDVQISWLKF